MITNPDPFGPEFKVNTVHEVDWPISDKSFDWESSKKDLLSSGYTFTPAHEYEKDQSMPFVGFFRWHDETRLHMPKNSGIFWLDGKLDI